MIAFGRGICGRLSESGEKEWLETNGRGGYAMGTVAGCNTRRYHGLLTVPLRPPVQRFQVLNRLEESVFINNTRYPLSCQAYPGVVHPHGYHYLERFRLDPFPVWTYTVSNVRLEKTFFLRYGEDTAVVLYRHLAGPKIAIETRPLVTCRDHHHIVREDERFKDRFEISPHLVKLKCTSDHTLFMGAEEGTFNQDSFWYLNQEYEWEKMRGLEHREDAFSPGLFRFELDLGRTVALVFSTQERKSSEALDWSRQERLLRKQILDKSAVRGPLADRLVLAADQFIVDRDKGSSVIAGYPWFEDWSRDAMISLPGLCLATGRTDEAWEMLELYAAHLKEGLLPVRFPDADAPVDYNAVDAPLWFILAVQKYLKATNDTERVKRLLPAMRQIADSYQRGTQFGIRMDQDGLIAASTDGQALTWMDAKVENTPVTPRSGKAVEIQALWYNALQFLTELDFKLNEPSRGYDKLAAIARASFNEKFWNESAGYLYDRINGRDRAGAVRPNALFAISLPYEILEESRFRPVVDTAWRELYTTYGLRTLAPGDPNYKGKFEGPPEDRDAAYHQGSVWAWLMGSFLTAYVKAYGPSETTKAQVDEFLRPLLDHLTEGGVGSFSEVFEGDAPHAPRGCPAQAWSVAEILRVLWEEGVVV
ncbi:MAG TPA: amylo-alpha-1,6-glucosidase [Elusimicrobiota bacterium]|nr:amylo-alpha-1,6-glucosidase [Elusimicrobiota bacterium]